MTLATPERKFVEHNVAIASSVAQSQQTERIEMHEIKDVTLRDYFAAMAMHETFNTPLAGTAEQKAHIARHAYEMADAMLRARCASQPAATPTLPPQP